MNDGRNQENYQETSLDFVVELIGNSTNLRLSEIPKELISVVFVRQRCPTGTFVAFGGFMCSLKFDIYLYKYLY